MHLPDIKEKGGKKDKHRNKKNKETTAESTPVDISRHISSCDTILKIPIEKWAGT